MARRRDHPQLEAADGQDVAVAEVVVAAADGAHPGAGQLGEPRGALGVVVVPVGEHGQGHPGAALLDDAQDGGEVALVERPGVDDDGLGRAGLEQHPGVRAVEGHRPGVGGEHAVRPGRDVAARPGAVTDGGGVAVTCPSMPWPLLAAPDGRGRARGCVR